MYRSSIFNCTAQPWFSHYSRHIIIPGSSLSIIAATSACITHWSHPVFLSVGKQAQRAYVYKVSLITSGSGNCTWGSSEPVAIFWLIRTLAARVWRWPWFRCCSPHCSAWFNQLFTQFTRVIELMSAQSLWMIRTTVPTVTRSRTVTAKASVLIKVDWLSSLMVAWLVLSLLWSLLCQIVESHEIALRAWTYPVVLFAVTSIGAILWTLVVSEHLPTFICWGTCVARTLVMGVSIRRLDLEALWTF